MNEFLDRWKQKAHGLKIQMHALLLAYRDPRTPWYARVFTALVVGYAFSPIDLIPDFIPILGYLDDLILLPLGVMIALRLIPAEVMNECQEKAHKQSLSNKPVNYLTAILIILFWVAILTLVAIRLYRRLGLT